MEHDREWSPAHDQLRDSLVQEVGILRELLSNLFQEEVFLSQKDQQGIFQIKEARTSLLKNLYTLRKQRLIATQQIKELIKTDSSKKKLDLEHLLPLSNENTSQVLSLREQMRALFEKMNAQKMRNHYLHHEWHYLKAQPAPLPKKKKSGIATFEQKR